MSEELMPVDGKVTLKIDDYYLYAKMVISEPENGGKAVTKEDVKTALAENGVVNNVDWDAIDKYMKDKLFGTSVTVAEGVAAVDGENGEITFTHEPTSDLRPQIDEETGTVNFRELGKVINIRKGELIADVKLPTEGTSGVDIRGVEVQPMPGKEASYTLGAGTVLSADRTKVTAAIDGNLRWDSDRFVVDSVVSVGGDVDVSVGNIDFVGDVIIKGSIREGFTVKGKNVTVFQSVSKANIISEGTVEVKGGAVFANIKSQGDVKLNFAENAEISCNGKLTAKSLVTCKVFCLGDITVLGGKGAIVGGECICCGNITASQVGSDSYARTVINLGNTAELTKEFTAKKDKYKTDYDNYTKLQKLYSQLSAMKNAVPLTEEQEQIRRQAFRFVMSEKPRLVAESQLIEESEALLQKGKNLRLMVKSRAFPGVNIRIFNSVYDNLNECGNCTFYLGTDGEVAMRPGTN